jgi:3-hydroxyisobutyrate dehydrogenase-like beta-hydroxyacid dehydrogenase
MRKDVALAEDLAAELGARLPTVAAAAAVLDDALRDGLGDADFASVITVLSAKPTDTTEEQ